MREVYTVHTELPVTVCFAYCFLCILCFVINLNCNETILFQGTTWGELSVSAGELLGRTHEELVLLLIQLRRQSAGVCKSMEICHREIETQVTNNASVNGGTSLVERGFYGACWTFYLLQQDD